MAKVKQVSRRKQRTFRIGGKILVRMGPTTRAAQVVEDRGPIGVGGRRILRVRYLEPKGEPQPTFEVPLDHVTAVKERAGRLVAAKTKVPAS